MSLLEKLEKDAASVLNEQSREAEAARKYQMRLARALNARLQSLYDYFFKFKEHLEVLSPDVRTTLLVDGLGELTDLRQQRYALYSDEEQDKMTRFTFRYRFIGERPLKAKVQSTGTVTHLREHLKRLGLKYEAAERRGLPSLVTIEPNVPVSFEFSMDLEKEVIRLEMRNVGTLGFDTYSFEPNQLDRKFADELAKVMLCRNNSFDKYTGNHLSNTFRMRIRQAVEEAKKTPSESQDRAAQGLLRAWNKKAVVRAFCFGRNKAESAGA